jgi:hypothetical protein
MYDEELKEPGVFALEEGSLIAYRTVEDYRTKYRIQINLHSS